MADLINPANLIQSLLQQQGAGAAKPGASTDAGALNFAEVMKTGVQNVRDAQMESETLSAKSLMGEADLTQVVQSVAKAEVMLQTMITIRDRLLSAYQELMSVRI
jgi:flagellar hook-basal body complex protein FliE